MVRTSTHVSDKNKVRRVNVLHMCMLFACPPPPPTRHPRPTSQNQFAFFAEDDIEVSPLYYRWIKAALERYYFVPPEQTATPQSTLAHTSIYGLCLQQQQLIPTRYPRELTGELRRLGLGHAPFPPFMWVWVHNIHIVTHVNKCVYAGIVVPCVVPS